MAIAVVLAIVGGSFLVYDQFYSKDAKTQSVTGAGGTTTTVASQVAEATKEGKVAQIGVKVRDVANADQNTKVAVATYCQDSKGNFIIDGVVSSTTADTKAGTTIGEKITCWAFNSTYQTKKPLVIDVTTESMGGLVIDAFRVTTSTGKLAWYDDQSNTGTGGQINVTVAGTNGVGTMTKIRIHNNVSNQIMPVGGFYFSTVPGANVTNIKVGGSAKIVGGSHSDTTVVASSLGNGVTSRKDNFDYVFEFDDDPTTEGNQALLLDQNDYVETGAVEIHSSTGCSPAGEALNSTIFTKGYYKSTQDGGGVKYGHQTDASPPAVVTLDIVGPNAESIYCKG